MFSNAIFESLIEKWLIYHKEKEFNDFGLKIRIFEISKIKIFEKNIFIANCSCDLKISFVEIFYHSDIWISAGVLLEIKIHCFERGRTLNLFCRVYIYIYNLIVLICDLKLRVACLVVTRHDLVVHPIIMRFIFRTHGITSRSYNILSCNYII